MSAKGKVILGYIHGGHVHARWMRAVINLLSYEAERDQRIKNLHEAESTDIVQNRNLVVKSFLEKEPEAEWLWFSDTDTVFEPDTLNRLLELADKDSRPIVSGMYFSYLSHEVHFPLPLMFKLTLEGEYRSLEGFGSEPMRIDGCGMGCCLIHRSVLELMEGAYKDVDPWVWFGRDVVTMKGRMTRLGEDFTFCRRASKLGFEIWGHCGVQVHHIKPRVEHFGTFLQGNRLYELEHGVDTDLDVHVVNPSEGPSNNAKTQIREVASEQAGQEPLNGNGHALHQGPDSRQANVAEEAFALDGKY